jgi:S-adenosylmethionine-diacylgycerolhomoserine-N-methlytransferase
MDAIYQRQRHVYNLTRKYYLLGRDQLIDALDVPDGGTVLEMGCGTGRNLIRVARRYPQARLFGIDISEAMLETAAKAVARAGLCGRITLAQGDATNFDPMALFSHQEFERIYFSYTLSMIPDWRAALSMAARVLAPGGTLRVVDFGQQERLPRASRAILHSWLKKFDVVPVARLEAEMNALASRIGAKLEFYSLYLGYAWHAALTANELAVMNLPH